MNFGPLFMQKKSISAKMTCLIVKFSGGSMPPNPYRIPRMHGRTSECLPMTVKPPVPLQKHVVAYLQSYILPQLLVLGLTTCKGKNVRGSEPPSLHVTLRVKHFTSLIALYSICAKTRLNIKSSLPTKPTLTKRILRI